jgi:acetylglutamate kinase/GNAT superfamily N-acetyltransferase
MENIEKICSEIGIKQMTYWTNLLKTLPKDEAGVIRINGKIIQNSLEQFCAEAAFLAEKGFYLPIVLGGGSIYDQLPDCQGVMKVNEYRVTSKRLAKKMGAIAEQNQNKIVGLLKKHGAEAVPVQIEAIVCEPYGFEMDGGEKIGLGYVGTVKSIDTTPIIEAIYSSKVPVITHMGVHKGDMYNIKSISVAKGLAKYLGAKKLLCVGDTPIVIGRKIVSQIRSKREFDDYVKKGKITNGMVLIGNEAFDLLNYLGPGHGVQITGVKSKKGVVTSIGLLEEYLGNGSGTEIFMPSIVTAYSLDSVGKKYGLQFLEGLINDTFKERGLVLMPEYFGQLSGKNPTVYLDSFKKGGAITYPLGSFEYMCKLFTHLDYQGIGIASAIIDEIVAQKCRVAWRTDKLYKKGIGFYDKKIAEHHGIKADNGKYAVFGIGFSESEKQDVIQKIAGMPGTFASA